MATSTVGGVSCGRWERAVELSAASYRTIQENRVGATDSDVFARSPAAGVLALITARRHRGGDVA